MEHILLVVHILLCIGIIVLVLMQNTSSDGMSGLSGGSMNMNSFLTGRAAANLLSRTTAILATAFFITSLALTYISNHKSSTSIIDDSVAPIEGTQNSGDKPVEKKTEEAPSVPMAQ